MLLGDARRERSRAPVPSHGCSWTSVYTSVCPKNPEVDWKDPCQGAHSPCCITVTVCLWWSEGPEAQHGPELPSAVRAEVLVPSSPTSCLYCSHLFSFFFYSVVQCRKFLPGPKVQKEMKIKTWESQRELSPPACCRVEGKRQCPDRLTPAWRCIWIGLCYSRVGLDAQSWAGWLPSLWRRVARSLSAFEEPETQAGQCSLWGSSLQRHHLCPSQKLSWPPCASNKAEGKPQHAALPQNVTPAHMQRKRCLDVLLSAHNTCHRSAGGRSVSYLWCSRFPPEWNVCVHTHTWAHVWAALLTSVLSGSGLCLFMYVPVGSTTPGKKGWERISCAQFSVLQTTPLPSFVTHFEIALSKSK